MSEYRLERGPVDQSTGSAAQAPDTLHPNMLLSGARATSSTFDEINFDHSIFHNATFANSLFAQTNLTGAAFEFCRMDGLVIERCSFRDVELRECDTTGLVVNGIHVGALIQRLTGQGA